MNKAAYILFFAVTIAAVGLEIARAQDDPAEPAIQLPTHVEYAGGDIVVQPIDGGYVIVTDQVVLDKLDEILGYLRPAIDTRPAISEISEQELFGIMSVASVYGARSKAALIWSYMHDGGNTIESRDDLIGIPGIGATTADALIPLVTMR